MFKIDYAKKIAAGLRSRRAFADMTQADVANLIEVGPATIVRWESDEGQKMPVEKAWALADYYGVSLDVLLGREV